jgi:hypothetical protein
MTCRHPYPDLPQPNDEVVSGTRYIVPKRISLLGDKGDNAGDLAWAARVFLLLDDENRVQEDYQLTVKPPAS